MVEDTRTGQAVHTGWLSAAPQRFFIGSNSFRTRTCFEERSEGIVALERKARPIGRNNDGQLPAGDTGRPNRRRRNSQPEASVQQSIAYPMSRAPAVWRYAGRAVRAAGDRLASLQVFRGPAGLATGCGGPAAGHSFFRSVLAARWSLDIRTKEESP
jgi:hypothetical protein